MPLNGMEPPGGPFLRSAESSGATHLTRAGTTRSPRRTPMLGPVKDVIAAVLTTLTAWTGNIGIGVVLMTVLRRKFKENPQQANVEVMNLYRSSGVNPFGGCLPTIVQIPVMFALFQVLNEKDRFAGQALFGLPLDARPNNFAAIADNPVLLLIPILMAVTTYLQQRISITDPQQARLFIFMPILIAWFSLSFPVGLSVYWIASTVVYLAEYLLLVGRPVRPAPPVAREGAPGRSPAGKTKKNP